MPSSSTTTRQAYVNPHLALLARPSSGRSLPVWPRRPGPASSQRSSSGSLDRSARFSNSEALTLTTARKMPLGRNTETWELYRAAECTGTSRCQKQISTRTILFRCTSAKAKALRKGLLTDYTGRPAVTLRKRQTVVTEKYPQATMWTE